MFRISMLVGAISVLGVISVPLIAQQAPGTPADGHTIHVTAPHVVAGKVMGPYLTTVRSSLRNL